MSIPARQGPVSGPLSGAVPRLPASLRLWGTVVACDGARVRIGGLSDFARLGDGIGVQTARETLPGEVVAVNRTEVVAMLMSAPAGLAAGQRAWLSALELPRPSDGWLGQVVDAFGRMADGRPAAPGVKPVDLRRSAPAAAVRRGLGARLRTGLAVTDTLLPLCRGQRLGVFAGSGVGKSMLLGALARGVAADVVVIGLIGERGREVGEFVANVLGPRGMARTVVVAASSDQTALVKRRAAMLTLAVAEHFRDQGLHVLCLFDSITRFAEAHREIALSAGEAPALRAYPPSTAAEIAALCERAGPGAGGMGDITAVFTVLVAGSDMDEPVADMVRGVLDGHIVLSREIAERGRYPAIDLPRSVSRSAPAAWSKREADLAREARKLISIYEEAAPMIQSGLYEAGNDPVLDRAVACWEALDVFVGTATPATESGDNFTHLAQILGREWDI